jgi:carbonic anhydrase/acetyltransferase-like protein (isoleucine patch superfamily)
MPHVPASGMILPYKGRLPAVADDAFIAPNAVLIGNVEIGSKSGIWFNCVLRGDMNEIRVGARTNIQDGTVIHVDSATFGAYLGDDVTVGHMALIHACTVEDGAMIGMNATAMDGSVVETGAILAAGALLPPGKRVPAGEMWAGTPARHVRAVTEKDRAMLSRIAPGYVALAEDYLAAGHDLRAAADE